MKIVIIIIFFLSEVILTKRIVIFNKLNIYMYAKYFMMSYEFKYVCSSEINVLKSQARSLLRKILSCLRVTYNASNNWYA
jgi:hypothetical protein